MGPYRITSKRDRYLKKEMKNVTDGWHQVSLLTSLLIECNVPVRAHTSEKNFDKAEDDISAWWGDPLDFGEWKETINRGVWVCVIY